LTSSCLKSFCKASEAQIHACIHSFRERCSGTKGICFRFGKGSWQSKPVHFGKIASQVGSLANPWLIFSKYIDAVDTNCVNSMLPKWETRLGGAQATMWTHCFAVAQAGRVEPTVQALIQNSTFVYK